MRVVYRLFDIKSTSGIGLSLVFSSDNQRVVLCKELGDCIASSIIHDRFPCPAFCQAAAFLKQNSSLHIIVSQFHHFITLVGWKIYRVLAPGYATIPSM